MKKSDIKVNFSKMLAMVVCAMLVFGMPMQAANAIGIRAGMPATITIGTQSNDPTTIGFAGRQWLVVGYSGVGNTTPGSTLTLLSKNIAWYGTRFSGVNNVYAGSDLQSAMDSAAPATGTPEGDLIQGRTLPGGSGNEGTGTYNADHIAGSTVFQARFWPLSVAEVRLLTNDVREANNYYWLRSPGNSGSTVAVVDSFGNVEAYGDNMWATDNYARPGFLLDISAVFFTSDAENGKTGTPGMLSAATPPTGAVKLTVPVSDPSVVNLDVVDRSQRTAAQGGMVSIAYTGAITGAGKYVSCAIMDASGVLYYGKLTTLASGDAQVNLPAGIPAGSYTLLLFNEQINGDNYTDYISNPINISLEVTARGAGRPASSLPKTGDDFPLGWMAAGLAVLAAGIAVAGVRLTRGRRRRDSQNGTGEQQPE